jgi:hypothetical protein
MYKRILYNKGTFVPHYVDVLQDHCLPSNIRLKTIN